MKYIIACLISCFYGLMASGNTKAGPPAEELRIILLRHAEKPDQGDNLSCAGFNRSLKLPDVLHKRFNVPDAIFVPAPGEGKRTKNARMLQTIIPFAVKYNLAINTSNSVDDIDALVHDLRKEHGTVQVVWEHRQ